MHRTQEQEPASLVRILRQMDARVVVIGVAEIERSGSVLAAGADNFVPFDHGSLVGIMVASALERRARGVTPPVSKVNVAWDN